MGSFFAKALKKMTGKTQIRIILIGLDCAGKTTMMYNLKFTENILDKPCYQCFNVDSVEFGNISISSWDIGFRNTRMKPLYRHYYQNTQGIIFMVDSSDRERISDSIFHHDEQINLLTFGFIRDQLDKNKSLKMKWPIELSSMIFEYCKFIPSKYWDPDGPNAKEELDDLLLEEELNGIPLLIYANKQDLPNAMSINEITNCLELNKILQKNRKWHIQELIATTGDGMYEGLDWLSTVIEEKKKANLKCV